MNSVSMRRLPERRLRLCRTVEGLVLLVCGHVVLRVRTIASTDLLLLLLRRPAVACRVLWIACNTSGGSSNTRWLGGRWGRETRGLEGGVGCICWWG